MFKVSKGRPMKAVGIVAVSVGMKFVSGFALAALFGVTAIEGLLIMLVFWGLVFLGLHGWKRSKRKWIEHGRAQRAADFVCAKCAE